MTESFVSKRTQIGCLAIVFAILFAGGFFVVQSGILDNPRVYVRNEGSVERRVFIFTAGQNPSSSVLKGFYLDVPPWEQGMCPVGRWEMGLGNRPGGVIPVAPGTRQTIGEPLAFPSGGPNYVRIDSSGTSHVGEPIPADTPDCGFYEIFRAQ